LAQRIAALYRLGHHVEVKPDRPGVFAREVGLRGFDCATCTDADKADRGCCPFLPGAVAGEQPTVIDSTGNDAHDLIRVCPRAIEYRNPALAAAVAKYPEVKAGGGPGLPWSGKPLGALPLRVSRIWALLEAAADRFEADVLEARRAIDKESLEAQARRGAAGNRRAA
jgi:hypothetical protein